MSIAEYRMPNKEVTSDLLNLNKLDSTRLSIGTGNFTRYEKIQSLTRFNGLV